jgi:hypothetical protein
MQPVSRQQHGKHAYTAIDLLLETVLSTQSQCKSDNQNSCVRTIKSFVLLYLKKNSILLVKLFIKMYMYILPKNDGRTTRRARGKR